MTLPLDHILALAIACAPQVETGTVQAIVKQESGGNPNAIGVTKAKLSHQPRTPQQAIHVASILQKAGIEFDVGIAQIRTTNLRKFGVSVEQALDPCTNMKLMQALLLESYGRAVTRGRRPGGEASLAAISAYNTGNFSAGFGNGYVAGVVAAHPNNGRK